MATLVASPEGRCSPPSGSRVNDGTSSKPSPLKLTSESSSASHDNIGFQRGFLLKAKARRKNRTPKLVVQPPPKSSTTTTTTTTFELSTLPSTSALQSIGPNTAPFKYEDSENKKMKEEKHSVPGSPAEKDSGWAKGFLMSNKNKEEPTVPALGFRKSIDKNRSNSKAQIHVPFSPKEQKSGWAKGFLTKNKKIKVKKATKKNGGNQNSREQSEHRQKIQSSNMLLMMDNDVDDNKQCSKIKAEIFRIADATLNPTLATGKSTPLITVVSEESASETVASSNPVHPIQHKSILDRNVLESKDERDGRMTISEKKCLMAPLMSTVKQKQKEKGEKEPTSSFMKEISTVRKSNNNQSYQSDLQGNRRAERGFIGQGGCLSMENTVETSKITSIVVSNNDDVNEDIDKSCRNDDSDNNTILRLQQEMERLLSISPKLTQDNKRRDNDRCDDFKMLVQRFSAPEHRRYIWVYLLKQMQHPHFPHKRVGDDEEKRRSKKNIQRLLFELFETEYSPNCQQHYEESIRGFDINGGFDINDVTGHPLESILRCVETETERKVALQVVFIIQEYFMTRYKEQRKNLECLINSRGSRNNTAPNTHAGRNRLLLALFIQLAGLSLVSQRTMLVQAAWETAILLSLSCIRDYPTEIWPSSLRSNNLAIIFWERVDSLVNQKLKWQQSKKKLNVGKIDELIEMKTKSNNILKQVKHQQEGLNFRSKLIEDFLCDLNRTVNEL